MGRWRTATAAWRSAERGRLVASTAIGLLAAAAGVLATAESLRSLAVSSDTLDLVGAVDQALAHLRNGQLQHWGGAYALLQAIPTSAMRTLGVSPANVIDGLVALNVLSFAMLAVISWRALERDSRAGAVLVLAVLLSGTLLWYMHSSVGEPLAAVVTLAAVVACWKDRHHLLASVFLLLAGLSKDTAIVFLLPLCLGASVGSASWADPSWRWRRTAWLAAAAAASLAIAAGYNDARFGSVLDTPYLGPLLYVPSAQTQASFFAAIWLSPNGGLLLYWPSFGALLVLASVAMVRTVRASGNWGARLRLAAPAIGVAAALIGMTFELSKWVAPLGWSAWGPRLILPWVPASAYLLVAAYSGQLERLLASLLRPAWRFGLFGAALAAASLPQYVAMVRPSLWQEVFVPDAACPVIPLIENGAAYYYRCTNHQLWTKGSMLLSAFGTGGDPRSLAIGIACAAGLVWLLSLARTTERVS
jgi:hypothetical protein